MSLTGNLNINTSLTQAKDGVDLSTPSEAVNQSAFKALTTGKMFHAQVDLPGDGISGFVFNDGSLTDEFGQTITLSAITSIYAKSDSTNTSGVFLSGGNLSPINSTPELLASEGLMYQSTLDVSTNSTIYVANAAVLLTAKVDFIVTGE